MFDVNLIKNVIVEFKLPFALDLKDCLQDEGYMVVMDEIPVMIKTQRIYNEQPTVAGIGIAGNSKLERDSYGLLSKTLIQVYFDNQTINLDKINKSMIRLMPNQFDEFAIQYVNHLIKVYRLVKEENYIRHIEKKDILGYNYYSVDVNDNIKLLLRRIEQSIEFNGDEGFDFAPEKDKEFRDKLKGVTFDLQKELEMSIKYHKEQGNYNLSLLQCAIYFENHVYKKLKSKLSNKKLDKLKRKECGCYTGIFEVCTKGFRDEFNFDFESTNEFKNFYETVLKKRNKIVHGEILEEIGEDECDNVIKNTFDAIKCIDENIKV